MGLEQTWRTFHMAYCPHLLVSPDATPQLYPDNPFLVYYAVYHHYRSLGWVVKGGIKFCVDFLLYKRGPVFSHAEWVSSV
jgi:tRNA-splicing endonuclease subunit Sen2